MTWYIWALIAAALVGFVVLILCAVRVGSLDDRELERLHREAKR